MKGLGRNTRFKNKKKYAAGEATDTKKSKKSYMGGRSTEVGKQAQSYKEYVKRMYGGGLTNTETK